MVDLTNHSMQAGYLEEALKFARQSLSTACRQLSDATPAMVSAVGRGLADDLDFVDRVLANVAAAEVTRKSRYAASATKETI